jgi:hypothetical protein
MIEDTWKLDLHIAIGCSASPSRATLPDVQKSSGGGQSVSVRLLVAVPSGMFCISERNGSAHVEAYRWTREILPSSVSGTGIGEWEPKKPSLTGHETTT